MISNLGELFLEEYFLINSFIDNRYDDNKILTLLKDIYFIDDNEFDRLNELLKNDDLIDIKSEDEYKRYKRFIQYSKMQGKKIVSDDINQVITIKGNMLKKLERHDIKPNIDFTNAKIERMLIDASDAGDIIALRILGLLKCEGIIVNKNLEDGLDKLLMVSKWGNIRGVLIYLRYEMNNELILDILNSIVKDTLYCKLPELVESRYSMKSDNYSKEVMLVKKAIALDKLDEERYDSISARLIYSNVIGYKDKEKILLSDDKNMLSDSLDLPLRLNNEDINVDNNIIKSIPFKREEQDIILGDIINNQDRILSGYKPLCIYSESNYLLNYYALMLKKSFVNSNVMVFEVMDLRDYELNPTKNNVLLRSLSEIRSNVYMFMFRGEIDFDILNNIVLFLKSSKRNKFILNSPSVTLDISNVLPICICDKDNYEKIKNYVNGVELLPIRKDEKSIIVKDIIDSKNVSISDEIMGKLMDLSLERIDSVIDKMIKNNVDIYNVEDTSLFLNDFIMKYKDKRTFGFGGVSNVER